MKTNALVYPITIYYDASCPLCTSEMQALKSRDQAERLMLVDCLRPDFADQATTQAGLSQRDLMQRIHAHDAAGRWLRGVDVFEAAYGAVGLRLLAFLWGCRLWRPLLDRLYPVIARHRQPLSRFGLPVIVRAGIGALGRTDSPCRVDGCDVRDRATSPP
jgi:predicted DCC family thiol-disulfide oxidoreductase YuxK